MVKWTEIIYYCMNACSSTESFLTRKLFSDHLSSSNYYMFFIKSACSKPRTSLCNGPRTYSKTACVLDYPMTGAHEICLRHITS